MLRRYCAVSNASEVDEFLAHATAVARPVMMRPAMFAGRYVTQEFMFAIERMYSERAADSPARRISDEAVLDYSIVDTECTAIATALKSRCTMPYAMLVQDFYCTTFIPPEYL